MADSWQPDASPLTQVRRAQQSMMPGTVDGRIREAAPMPARQASEASAEAGDVLFVGPEDPGLDAGYPFWFDTDDIVPA